MRSSALLLIATIVVACGDGRDAPVTEPTAELQTTEPTSTTAALSVESSAPETSARSTSAAPTDPAPTDPAPTDPAPTDPASTDGAPTPVGSATSVLPPPSDGGLSESVTITDRVILTVSDPED